MKKALLLILLFTLIVTPISFAGFLDKLFKDVGVPSTTGLDNETVISGLKEALSVGTENAVKQVSQLDGYLSNEAIKILMPEKIKKVADVLSKVGYQGEVDSFIESMNRAAEKAAPEATKHFVDAIKGMTIDDAKKILDGGDTAATDYFREKTSTGLYDTFKPIVSSSMDEVGVTKSYKDMINKYLTLPFVKEESLDLDHHVTNKSLEGLFHVIAEEETKIRTDPAARVTDLLKTVFDK